VKPAGRVVLVGAGPGDAELLTLKAVRMLRAADVVLHDDLVSADVLARVNPAARIVAVGKRGGCASTPQAFIDQLMIREARAGALVVRLKGGDPFVFGRGGEEMSALRAAGITVDVVNGITAGLAAPAAIGVPLTHRSLAHGVVFVTAHAAGDGEGPDWQLLARCGLTLVIYMGGARAEALRQRLLAAGMDPSMPVAVIVNATRSDQQAIVSTLRDFTAAARDGGFAATPAIIVVGNVAALGAAAAIAAAPAKAEAARRIR
jgi:uroporphyrin-III C-methyltransferase